MASLMPFDPRDPPVLPSRHEIEQAKIDAAKEALQAIVDALPDGLEALLRRDRLRDQYGSLVLDRAFDRLLDERRRRHL